MELLIGDALVRWNFITHQDLDAGLALMHLTHLPLGKSLCALNLLSESDLLTCVQVQSMLHDEILSESEADRVMHLCRFNRLSLSQALQKTGLISLSGKRVSLGQLFVESGCLKQADLQKPLQISRKTGLPLGVVLVSCKLIDSRVLDTVLRYQRVRRLNKSVCDFQILKHEIEKVQENSKLETAFDTRLGSLLQAAGIITKTQLAAALEISLMNAKKLGEVLVLVAWIKQKTLEAALALQKAIRSGHTDLKRVAQLLRHVHLSNNTLPEIITKIVPAFIRDLSFGEFLVISGFIEREHLQTVRREYTKTSTPVITNTSATAVEDAKSLTEAICRAGISTQTIMNVALKYWQSARTGLVSLVSAIVLLAEHLINEEQILQPMLVPGDSLAAM